MTEQDNLPTVTGDKKIDNEIVKQAVSQIKFILIENFGNASYQVVDYLLENFFDGDKENLKAKKLDGNNSFQSLLVALQDETGKSKAWLYEAIKLWLDREYFKGLDQKTNEQYLELSISHRALLLKVSDLEDKIKYAHDFYVNKITYKAAKQMVRRESPDTEYSKLSRIINHLEEFDEESFKKKAGKSNLKSLYEKLKKQQMSEIVKKVNVRVETIENQIKENQDLLNRAKSVKKHLDLLSEEVGKKGE